MNKQTIAIVVALIVVGFVGYTLWHGNTAPTGGTATTTPDHYSDVSAWQTENDARGYSVSYPIDFETNEVHSSASVDWRINANGNSGMALFTLIIPKVFEPQTNFSEAKLTVGMSSQAKAVEGCLTPDPSGGAGATLKTITINGVAFSVFTFSDAGAGNLYDTTSYRAVHNGACWAIEYAIHSTQLANYPAELHLTQFDAAKVHDVLDRVVGTVVLK